MKKILFPLSMAVAMLFTACDAEYGTSTEVVDANEDENVNPAHLNDYKKPGTAGYQASGTKTTDLDLPADQLVVAYYTENNPEEFYKAERYSFSSTQQMAGQSSVDTTIAHGDMPENETQATGVTLGAPADGESAPASGSATRPQSERKTEKNKKERKTPYTDQ